MRAIFAVVAFAAALLTACSLPVRHAPADATVKVITKGGHGSGFHIGDGYLITAAHVVGSAEKVSLKTSLGGSTEAEVLWSNKAYDVALLRLSGPAELQTAPLVCRVPQIGEAITAKGNPATAEFITVWGKVAGSERSFGPWRSVVVTNIATVPGQSGGPVFDAGGNVIGVTVGVMASPVGFSVSLVGIGYVVPARTVCDLLARGA